MRTLLLRGLSVLFILISYATFAITPAQLPKYSKVYDEQADPFKDAVAAIALAKKTNRSVLIEVGGNWCAWCHRMDTFLTQHPRVFQALHRHYVLLKVNVSDANDNAAFMAGLPPVLGYPHMYVADNNGKVLLSKDTDELLANGAYSAPVWLAFLARWQINAKPNSVTQTTH